jgi:hypothetical protein
MHAALEDTVFTRKLPSPSLYSSKEEQCSKAFPQISFKPWSSATCPGDASPLFESLQIRGDGSAIALTFLEKDPRRRGMEGLRKELSFLFL